MRARRASPIGSPQWCALRVGIGGTSRILVLLSPITSLHSLPGAGSAPARGVTLFSGLAAGCHTPPSCMDGRPRGVRINATRIVVENVRLELTEGCLQSIPAPLRIPRVHPAALVQRRPAPVLIGSRYRSPAQLRQFLAAGMRTFPPALIPVVSLPGIASSRKAHSRRQLSFCCRSGSTTVCGRPAAAQVQHLRVPPAGIEPARPASSGRCSTN